MERTRHLIIAILLSFVIIAIGTGGYMLLEGWPLIDALYMTVITMSTVGYSEVHEMSPGGRVFTIFLVFGGVGFALYVAGAVVQFMVEGRVQILLGRRKLDKQLNRLKNHYVVCGYGRIGRVLTRMLRRKPMDVVVIEKDPALIPVMEEDGVPYLCGDAADEALLIKAGIERAQGLASVLATDTDNVFLVLTAKQLAPDIQITARAGNEASKKKLRAAGADAVESPYDMGAARMAQRIIRPTVTSFLDLAFADRRQDIQMEEIPVSDVSPLANVMLKDSGIRQQFDLILIAVKKPDGSMIFNPHFETTILSGDTVIAVGKGENLIKLEKVLNA
jgi:voltage-gated potassium channel